MKEVSRPRMNFRVWETSIAAMDILGVSVGLRCAVSDGSWPWSSSVSSESFGNRSSLHDATSNKGWRQRVRDSKGMVFSRDTSVTAKSVSQPSYRSGFPFADVVDSDWKGGKRFIVWEECEEGE